MSGTEEDRAKMGVEILTLSNTEYDRYQELWAKTEKDGSEGLTGDERTQFISLGMRAMYVKKEDQWEKMSGEFKELRDMKHQVTDIEVHMVRLDNRLMDQETTNKTILATLEKHTVVMNKLNSMTEKMTAATKKIKKDEETRSPKKKDRKSKHQDDEEDDDLDTLDGNEEDKDEEAEDSDLEILEDTYEDIPNLVRWPPDQLKMMESNVQFRKELPKDTPALIKRILMENSSRFQEKDKPGRAHQRVKEIAKEIAAHAVTFKLPGKMILPIFRQCMDESMREFHDTLKETHDIPNRRIWYELMRNSGVAYTEIDAIRELNLLNMDPAGLTFNEIVVKIPNLVRIRQGALGNSDEARIQIAAQTVDALHNFLILQVKSQVILPQIQAKYAKIRVALSKQVEDRGLQKSAYLSFVNQLKTIPQLKNMTFHGKKSSGLTNDDGGAQEGAAASGHGNQGGGGGHAGQRMDSNTSGQQRNQSRSNSRGNQDNFGGSLGYQNGRGAQGAQRAAQPGHQSAGGQQGATNDARGYQQPQQGSGQYMSGTRPDTNSGGQNYGNQGGQMAQREQPSVSANYHNGNRQPMYNQPPPQSNPRDDGNPNYDTNNGPRVHVKVAYSPHENGQRNGAHGTGYPQPASFPQELMNRCWLCADDSHRNRDCNNYPNDRVMDPRNPNNQCRHCGCFHTSQCIRANPRRG
jgi:hypothetical protein